MIIQLRAALERYETYQRRYPERRLMPETEVILEAARAYADLLEAEEVDLPV